MNKFLWRQKSWRYPINSLKLLNRAFNTPRPPKDPPDEGYQPTCVDHNELEVADFVRPSAFRKFDSNCEVLGPGAGKTKDYKNPHYFGYHRFSFVELQNQSVELRDELRLSGGVQMNMGEEDEEECADDSLEGMKQQEEECEKMLAAQKKDDEKAKLKEWCENMKKKQQREAKSGDSSKSVDRLKAWCEEFAKKQQDRENAPKLEKEREKIQKTIDKRVNEILSECTSKLEKTSSDGESSEKVIKQALAECEELVKTAAEKGKGDEDNKMKEQEKCEEKDNKKKEKGDKKD